jgi:hypothetical protein
MSYVVVVERGKVSTTVGPYAKAARAQADVDLWNGTHGRTAWIEVIVPYEAYVKQFQHELEQESKDA